MFRCKLTNVLGGTLTTSKGENQPVGKIATSQLTHNANTKNVFFSNDQSQGISL